MQPKNIQQTHQDISIARLSSYKRMFPDADDHQLYGVYCWNEALSASLFRLISMTEVVLRNRLHRTLSLHVSSGTSDSTDWYNQLSLLPKSQSKIEQETHYWDKRSGQLKPKKRPPSANDVVSHMTFGFWPKTLDITGIPWETLLPDVVPGHRYATSAYWKTLKHRDALYARLELVNQLRNRVAHFEPIWKQGALYEEKRQRKGSPAPAVTHTAPTTPADAIQRLRLLHDRTAELLKWLSPDRFQDYRSSYVAEHFDWLCSEQGLDAYMGMQAKTLMPLSRFKRELNRLLRNKSVVTVVRHQQEAGVLYPRR